MSSLPGPPPKGSSAASTKPPLPPGWSCHVSKSVPGRCYYFNKFTGAKTWELGELLPGHSDHHPSSQPPLHPVGNPQQQQLLHLNQQSCQNHSVSSRRADHHTGQSAQQYHNVFRKDQQGHTSRNFLPRGQERLRLPLYKQDQQQVRRPRLTGPPLDPVTTGQVEGDDEVANLGVAELEAMLAEKKKNIEQMVARQSSTPSMDGSVDTSSVESGFVSLVGKDDTSGVGVTTGGYNKFKDRQRELTESGGLYSDWGQESSSTNHKRIKTDFDINMNKTETVKEDAMEVKDKGYALKTNNNLNLGASEKAGDSDSDSLDNESLCIADSEELATLANLEKKFSVAEASPDKSDEVVIIERPVSPPDLVLLDTECQFSPEPDGEEEGDSDG